MLALIFAAALQAGSLDAPVNTAPTVRSEIARGKDAAFSTCYLTSDFMRDPLAYEGCIIRITASNRNSMSNGSEAFSLGAYYEGWVQEDLAGASEAVNELAAEIAGRARPLAKVMFPVLKEYQHKLGLSDDQLLTAVNAGSKQRRRFTDYEASSPVSSDMPAP